MVYVTQGIAVAVVAAAAVVVVVVVVVVVHFYFVYCNFKCPWSAEVGQLCHHSTGQKRRENNG